MPLVVPCVVLYRTPVQLANLLCSNLALTVLLIVIAMLSVIAVSLEVGFQL